MKPEATNDRWPIHRFTAICNEGCYRGSTSNCLIYDIEIAGQVTKEKATEAARKQRALDLGSDDVWVERLEVEFLIPGHHTILHDFRE